MRIAKALAAVFTIYCCSVSSAVASVDGEESPSVWSATLIQSDLVALYDGLKSGHANLFANRSEAEYDALFHELHDSIRAPMDAFEARRLFQRFAAFGDVAHARVDFPNEAFEAFRAAEGKTFPIYPRIVDGIPYVGENYSGESSIHAGDEIVALNGVPMQSWLERVSAYISADSDYIAHSLLEFTFPREFWALNGEVERFDLVLQRDGQRVETAIRATTRAAQQAAAANLAQSFSLDEGRSYRMATESIAYLRPGPFYSIETPEDLWDNGPFVSFIDQSFEFFLDQKASRLIIDLRQNPGGDSSFSDAMLAWLADEPFRFYSEFLVRSSDEAAESNKSRLSDNEDADSATARFAAFYARTPRGELFSFDLPYATPRTGARFEGEVYVLVNRHSYSNAVNVAAIVKDYQFGTIVGEKTADFATTYGAMEQFVLPGTGIVVGFPKAHIIRPNGDRQPDGVTPDWLIHSPTKNESTDRVLQKLLLMIEGDTRNQS
ncbi:MAG: S41 family peptidase [Pseudomonadota bacterium]